MGIQLDWQIESESGWQDIEEDPQELLRRAKRFRRLRQIALILLAVLLVGGSAVTLRLRQAARQRAFALETTFAAQTAALRVGDRTAFLSLQLEDPLWLDQQSLLFDEYAALGSQLTITGDILEQTIDANRARIVTREMLAGEPYLVYWHYEFTDQGWRHTPPTDQFWGNRLTTAPGPLRFTYVEADQPTVDVLLDATRDWLCACNLPSIEIRLSLEPGIHPGFSPTESDVLLIPSPLVGRVSEDGQVDPAILSTIAEALAGHYAQARTATLPTQVGAWERDWQQAELATYYRHRFDPQAPESAYLDPLIASSEVFARSSYAVLLASINDTDPQQYPEAWNGYLSAMLNAEADFHVTNTDDSVLNYVTDNWKAPAATIDPEVELLAEPGSIEVLDVRHIGRLYWADLRFLSTGRLRGSQAPNYAYEPFVERDGRLFHTNPTEEDWGELRERRGANIILRYYALDENYSRSLLATLETAYLDYLNELSVSITPPQVLVSLSPHVDGLMFTPDEIESMRPVVWFVLRSPYVVVRGEVDTPESQLEANAIWKLRENMYEYFTFTSSNPFSTP